MDAQLFAAIAGLNGHWRGGQVPAQILKHESPRRNYFPLKDLVDDKLFHLLVGPRQVGKTTLMGHLMQHLLDSGVPPRNIVYMPMDHPRISSDGDLLSLVEGLMERIEGRLFLFVDELQTSPDWATALKATFDAHHGQIHLFGSGSNALSLASPKSHGVGRWQHHWILPLNFGETFDNPGEPPDWKAQRALRDCLRSGATLESVWSELEVAFYELLSLHPGIQGQFQRFVERGGFPASWTAEEDKHTQFLDTVVHYGLQQDLLGLPQVRKPDAVLQLLGRLAMANGGKLSVNKQAQELDASRESISSWLKALDFAFMIRRIPAVDKAGNVQARSWEKVYIQDSGVRGYLAVETRWDDIERGRVGETIEGVVLDHLHRLQSSVIGHPRGIIGYHAKPEVDFVAPMGKNLVALEVKYGQDEPGHLQNLFTDGVRIVVTKKRFEFTESIAYLPAWFFCYLC